MPPGFPACRSRAIVRVALAGAAAALATIPPAVSAAQERTAREEAVADAVLSSIPPAVSAAQERPAREAVAEIRVHGNLSLSDAEVIALAGVELGDAAGPDLAETVGERLEASGRFETVDVRRLYRSLTATDEVALVIVVRERPGARWRNPVARALAAAGRRLMVAPIVDHREGYGVAYGALISFVDAFGPGGRLSVPATWGGHKRIGLEMEVPVPGRLVDRLRAGGWRGRRRHPHFEVDDDRTGLEVAVERGLPGGFRLNGAAAWEDVRFAAAADRLFRSAVHLDYGDYRETPATARRNTVVVRAGIGRFAILGGGAAVLRPRLDARAYASAGGQAVLAARLFYVGASGPLPPYERALLGGSPAARGTLRGWPAGEAVGDRIAAASIELRLPVTSLLSQAQVGLRFFGDAAAVYDADSSLRRAGFLQGAGVGVFVMPPGFGVPVSFDVAHDFAGGVRTHVSAGFGF